jgi:hypothetical protein
MDPGQRCTMLYGYGDRCPHSHLMKRLVRIKYYQGTTYVGSIQEINTDLASENGPDREQPPFSFFTKSTICGYSTSLELFCVSAEVHKNDSVAYQTQ